jgi:hypothetical protein
VFAVRVLFAFLLAFLLRLSLPHYLCSGSKCLVTHLFTAHVAYFYFWLFLVASSSSPKSSFARGNKDRAHAVGVSKSV